MIRRNKISLLIICVLAFAVTVYFSFYYKKGKINPGGEGLSHFRVETFEKSTGWGYQIYQDTSAVIEQLYIPGVPGTNGFHSKEEALKTGKLMQKKLDMGIFPPTIATRELDSMGVRY